MREPAGFEVTDDHHPPSHPPRLIHLRQTGHRRDPHFIDAWNDRCVPFVWTKTADDILAVANRKAASATDH